MIKVMLNRNSQPSFGMNLSKDTVKFLKSSAPKLIENDGYTAAKEGINRLVALTNREDGIKAKISTTRFDEYKIMVKNNKLKKYISIPIYDKISLLSKNKGEELNKFSKYISTSEFLEKSNKAIEKRIEYEKNISFSKRLNRKFQSFKRKTSKLAGNISEGLSLEYVYKNGQQPYIGIDFIENIKDFIAGSKKLFLKKQKNINNPEQNSLVKLINKLSK